MYALCHWQAIEDRIVPKETTIQSTKWTKRTACGMDKDRKPICAMTLSNEQRCCGLCLCVKRTLCRSLKQMYINLEKCVFVASYTPWTSAHRWIDKCWPNNEFETHRGGFTRQMHARSMTNFRTFNLWIRFSIDITLLWRSWRSMVVNSLIDRELFREFTHWNIISSHRAHCRLKRRTYLSEREFSVKPPNECSIFRSVVVHNFYLFLSSSFYCEK